MKSSVIFLILFLTGIAVKAQTVVNVDKNIVRMEEVRHTAETGFVTTTIKPNSLTMEPTIKEIDPQMLNDQVVDMQTRTQEEQKLLEETRELEVIEKELPAMKEACQKKKHEALDLNKQIIDLKEIVEKSKKDVKEGKITTKTFQDKTFETEKKITTLQNKKAEATKLAQELEVKAKEQEGKAVQIKSRLDKKIEKNPARLEEDKRSHIIEKCKDHINRKELTSRRIETLSNEVGKIREQLKRETSAVIKKELAKKVEELVKEIKNGEQKVTKLDAKIKSEKKVIRESTKALKQVQKQQEKEKLRDLVKGECTAKVIRAHKRFCLKKDAKGVCAQWGSIYRTEKCVKWNGDKCAEFSYNYSKKNGRFECASRDHTYKVEKCLKFDTQGKCLGKRMIFGTKKCLTYSTNNGQLVCLENKVVFPQISCKNKVGDICTELKVHKAKFFCQTFGINKDGHRYCHKYDVIFGKNNFDLECLKEGNHQGKSVGCLEYKKVGVKGAPKLQKMSKTWLKENCKALNKSPVSSFAVPSTRKSVEENGNKNAVVTVTESIKDAEAEKVIESCKKQIKDKLKVIRASNRIVGGRTETVVPKTTSDMITENQKVLKEEAAQIQSKQQEIVVAQEEARKEIKSFRNSIAREEETIFKQEELIVKGRVSITQAKDNKIVVTEFSNGKLVNKETTVQECQKKIEEAKAIISESKAKISKTIEQVKQVEKSLQTKIGRESSQVVIRVSKKETSSQSVFSKCNKKIVEIESRIVINESKLTKATGVEKSKLVLQIAQDRNRVNKLESKKISKSSDKKFVEKASKKVIKNLRNTVSVLKKELKNTTDASVRKSIIAEIRKSEKSIYKAQVLLLEKGSSKSVAKNSQKIIAQKKSQIAKINAKIENLKKGTQTPETKKTIERLTKKAAKIEKQAKKIENIAKISTLKKSSFTTVSQESKTIAKWSKVSEAKKTVSEKKEKIVLINKKIEELKKSKQTPETARKIEKLTSKVVKIEKQVKKIEKQNELRIQRLEKQATTKVVFKTRRASSVSVAQVRREVAKKNTVLREKCNKDLQIIREDKSKIIRLQQQLKTVSEEKKPFIINAIKETQDDIEAKVEQVTNRKEMIIKNKQIVIKMVARRTQTAPARKVLTRKEVVEVVVGKIKVYREKISTLEKRVQVLQKSLHECKTEKCSTQYTLQIQELNHKIHEEVENIKEATTYQNEITEIIKKIHEIKLVKTFYKKNVTCVRADNWKAFRVIRKQRLALIKRSTKNIVRLEKANTPSARNHLRRWRNEVNRQIRKIDSDKKKTIKVIKSCNKLYTNKDETNTLVGGGERYVERGCNESRIRQKSRGVQAKRAAKIQVIKAKLTKKSAELKSASGARKAKLEKIVSKCQKKIRKQQKLVRHDRKMYRFVIRQCALIKQNSLTVVRRRTGVTCDPIKLRNRVHSIVNTHYLTILRARNNIKINKLRLTTENNESARKALINGITQFRALALRKQQQVAKARVSLGKAISVCRKYGYFIKNIIKIRQYKFSGQKKRFVVRRYKLSLKNGLKRVKNLRYKYVRKWRVVKGKDGKVRRYARFVRVRVSGCKSKVANSLPRLRYVRKWKIVKGKDGKTRRYAHFVRVRVSGGRIYRRRFHKTNISVRRGGKKIVYGTKKAYRVRKVTRGPKVTLRSKKVYRVRKISRRPKVAVRTQATTQNTCAH